MFFRGTGRMVDEVPRRHRLFSVRRILADDTGMSTVEYAIGSIAAAALAAALYAVVTGDSVVSGIEGLIQRALAGPL